MPEILFYIIFCRSIRPVLCCMHWMLCCGMCSLKNLQNCFYRSSGCLPHFWKLFCQYCSCLFCSDFHNFLPSCRCFLFYRISIEYIIALFVKNGKVNINGTFNKISLLVTVHFILQYFQICSEGCPKAAKWSDLTQDVADTEQSDSLVQERNRGCADQYEEYEDLAYQ